MITIFVYANIGAFCFGDIMEGVILGEEINFKNVLFGMLTLFKCLTCDNWVDIMYDVINFQKDGKESIRNNTSIKRSAQIIFI